MKKARTIMKKILLFIIIAALLLSAAGCRDDGPVPQLQPTAAGTEAPPTETEAVPTTGALEFQALYIRTDGTLPQGSFPRVQVIQSKEELLEYCRVNREHFNLEYRDSQFSDSVTFLELCEAWEEDLFQTQTLVLILLEEGSGSIRHAVNDAVLEGGKLALSVERKIPEVGTCDMAQWHILVTLPKLEDLSNDGVELYVDGILAWDGAPVPITIQPRFTQPPAGTLRTPEGDVELTLGGYSWIYEEDGTGKAVIADQAGRPLPRDHVPSIAIDGKYTETVYEFREDLKHYIPTNRPGFLVKLAWEQMPQSVTVACWPEAVWEDSSRGEQPVSEMGAEAFYAEVGSYVYEIHAVWEDCGRGYHGEANYYVHIVGG